MVYKQLSGGWDDVRACVSSFTTMCDAKEESIREYVRRDILMRMGDLILDRAAEPENRRKLVRLVHLLVHSGGHPLSSFVNSRR